ncbi:hypothetical protein, partial [Nostoc sp. FACHB-888]|uniref:hypothetical protein n=1 Tax=Nostoc sp. FACHB-888 TaxID=2692842 RepID=UPI001A7E8CC9
DVFSVRRSAITTIAINTPGINLFSYLTPFRLRKPIIITQNQFCKRSNRDAAGTKQILDLSNNSVQVSKVPEGSIIIGLLAVWSLGFSLKQKFNPKSKI